MNNKILKNETKIQGKNIYMIASSFKAENVQY